MLSKVLLTSWLLVSLGLLNGCSSHPDDVGLKLGGTVILSSGADEVFKNRRLFPIDLARPDDLPGSVVYLVRLPDGDEWYYEPLSTENPEVEMNERKLFEAIVDQSFLAGASATLFVSFAATMEIGDKAEILIKDLYTLKGPERVEMEEEIKAWIERSDSLRPVQAFYCRATLVSTAVSQIYRKVSVGGEISGPVFGANGEYYRSESEYAARLFITWDAIPITLPGSKGGEADRPPPLQINRLSRRR